MENNNVKVTRDRKNCGRTKEKRNKMATCDFRLFVRFFHLLLHYNIRLRVFSERVEKNNATWENASENSGENLAFPP